MTTRTRSELRSDIDGTVTTNGVRAITGALLNALLRNFVDSARLPEDVVALSASVAANALTVAVKLSDGSDPSSTSPLTLAFRDATATSGLPVLRQITSALSLTIPSGATLGFSSGSASRLWVVAFDDGGTVRLGVVNCLNGKLIYRLGNSQFASSTAIDTGSDSAHVIYTDAAVTTKPYVVLGYLSWSSGLVTTGTWTTSTVTQVMVPGVHLPGEVVRTWRVDTSDVATGTTSFPVDDTVPLSYRGDEYFSLSVTPYDSANLLTFEMEAMVAVSVATTITAGLRKDAGTYMIAANSERAAAANDPFTLSLKHAVKAGSTSAATYAVRIGRVASATITLNGSAGSRIFGGIANSFFQVDEVMA